MTLKPTNLRFLLSLGSTKIVVLQDENDLHVYTRPVSRAAGSRDVVAEHITEALCGK